MLLLPLMLALAAIPRISSAEALLVDRVVLVVGAAGAQGDEIRIVTAFELEIEARLALAEGPGPVENAALEPSDQLYASVLDAIVRQLLLVDEATRLQLIDPEDEQLAAERATLETRLGGAGSIERFCEITGATTEMIDEIVLRRFVAIQFARQNIELAAPVSESELQQVYESGDHPFGDRPLETIRSQLQAFIQGRRLTERLNEWFQQATRRTRIRRLVDEPEPAPQPEDPAP